jgi:hypothetical protein
MKTIIKKPLLITLRRKNKNNLKNFVRLYSAIKIQSAFRKYQITFRKSDIKHTVVKETDKVLNDTTFIGNKLTEIEKVYFYTHSNYFFDIRELIQHLRHSSKHPYTNIVFSKFTINQIFRINRALINNYINYKTLDEENNSNLSDKNIISSLKTNVFIKMDSCIGVSNVNVFNNYNEFDLYCFVEKIMIFSLINSLFDVNEILYQTYYFYKKFENERKSYIQDSSHYFNNFYKHRFRFHYHVINILSKILNTNDNHLTTRCLIINENIYENITENTYEMIHNADDNDENDDNDDNDDNDENEILDYDNEILDYENDNIIS